MIYYSCFVWWAGLFPISRDVGSYPHKAHSFADGCLWPTSSLRALNIPKCCEFSRPGTCQPTILTTSSDPGFINHREAVTAILRLKSHQRHPRKSYPRKDFHPGSRSPFWDSSYSLLYFRRGSERFENTGRLVDQSGEFSSGVSPFFRILFS
jgi:hypothetical protein